MWAIAGLAMSVVCGYLGFAVYDDHSFRSHLKPREPEQKEAE